jgi:hypothetical protein
MPAKTSAKKSATKPVKKSAKRVVKPSRQPRNPALASASLAPTLYDRLHAVLHAVRTIAHFEDSLCVLLEHVRSSGELRPDAARELSDLLERLPAHLYLQDLEALRHALPAPTSKLPAKSAKRPSAKRSR